VEEIKSTVFRLFLKKKDIIDVVEGKCSAQRSEDARLNLLFPLLDIQSNLLLRILDINHD